MLLAHQLGHKGRCLRSRLPLLLARGLQRIRRGLRDRLPQVLLVGGLGSSPSCGRRLLLVLAQGLWHKGRSAGGALGDQGSFAGGEGPCPCSAGHRGLGGA